jgi:AAHS family cis,cis-muconate transporter-like MFS transporter
MNSIFPLYLKFDLKMSLIDIGTLSALVTIGTALGNIIGGWLSDRVGRLKVLGSAFVFGATGLFLIPLANDFWTLVPLVGLAGMCFGFVYSVAPAMVSENFSSSIRGVAIGVYRTSFDIGGFLGPFATAAIATFFGNKMTFYVVSGLLALNILVAFSMRKMKRAK